MFLRETSGFLRTKMPNSPHFVSLILIVQTDFLVLLYWIMYLWMSTLRIGLNVVVQSCFSFYFHSVLIICFRSFVSWNNFYFSKISNSRYSYIQFICNVYNKQFFLVKFYNTFKNVWAQTTFVMHLIKKKLIIKF